MHRSKSFDPVPALGSSSAASSSSQLSFRGREISASAAADAASGYPATPRADFERLDAMTVPADYREALVRALREDAVQAVTAEDFASSEGYYLWMDTYNSSLQEVLVQLIRWRFADEYAARARQGGAQSATPGGARGAEVPLYFRVVEARGLLAKEGKPRHAYAVIEVGPERWKTDVAPPGNDPTFNQHLNLTASDMMSHIRLTVMDARKDEFLGEVVLPFAALIKESLTKGFVAQWYPLGAKQKDRERGREPGKFVGGSIYVEASIRKDEAPRPAAGSPQSISELQEHLIKCRMSPKRLYALLLGACLNLDLFVNKDSLTKDSTELLGRESKDLLHVFARLWALSDAFCVVSYLELLFEKFKKFQVPNNSLLAAYETLYRRLKTPDWINSFEQAALLDLLERMYRYFETQVANYKDFYPKNRPPMVLETTIGMLRRIHKTAVFRDTHPHLPVSFREALRALMAEAAVRRYQKLAEMSQPFDNSVAATIESSLRLAETIVAEFEMDVEFFRQPFRHELDIITITAETYLKYFVLELENITGDLQRREALEQADRVFELYRKVRLLDKKYAPIVPGLKRLSMSAGFNVERWFAPFVNKWVASLAERMAQWAANAVRQDRFLRAGARGPDELAVLGPSRPDVEVSGALHSSSITDLVSALHQNFETLGSLGWSNEGQNAQFMLKYAKTINAAMEAYCDLVLDVEHRFLAVGGDSGGAVAGTAGGAAAGDRTGDAAGASSPTLTGEAATSATAQLLTSFHLGDGAAKLLGGSSKTDAAPVQTVQDGSCVRLSNIEFALRKVDQLYHDMNAKKVNEELKLHLTQRRALSRAGMNLDDLMNSINAVGAALAGSSDVGSSPARGGAPEEDPNLGTFSFQVCRGDKLKPSSKNGLASAYVLLRTGATAPAASRHESSGSISSTAAFVRGLSSPPRDSTGDARGNTASPATLGRSSGGGGTLGRLQGATSSQAAAAVLAKTRVITDSLQPTWDETFQALVYGAGAAEVEVLVYHKNMLFTDELIGRGTISLSGRLLDHQTHDEWVALEPQGRVLVRVTKEGEEEDIVFWFRRSYAKLVRTRDDFRRVLVGSMCPFVREYLQRALKAYEAVPEAKSWLPFGASAASGAVGGQRVTAAGASIDEPMSLALVEDALADLTEYLDRNFNLLFDRLAPSNAQEVIKLLWNELLVTVENLLLPQLFGLLERDRHRFNRRQISFVSGTLTVLCRFFHPDGEEGGIPLEFLQSRRWRHLQALLPLMTPPLSLLKIRREVDLSKLAGRSAPREQLLRLVRLVVEGPHSTRDPSVDPDPLDQREVSDLKSYYELSLKTLSFG